MEIRSVIIDDEAGNRENLHLMLARHCQAVKVVATAASAADGLKIIREYHPDLVFLDIEMPHRNGFDLLEDLPAIDFEVIFVTAFDQYAIRAIKFCALDYLLKPIDMQELKDAVNRVEEQMVKNRQNENLRIFMQNRLPSNQAKKIALPTADKVDFVDVNEIIRCQGESNYTHIFLRDGSKILVSRTLKEYEHLLEEYNFLRVHQSHLINIAEVRSYVKREGGYIMMSDGAQVSVSKQKKESILRRLTE
ncbi:MAG: LytTR family DNA-binding domain-containing protein [Saprospiraceae bacterium]|nr:response regulator transcription factor [Lewinella sp.]